MDGTGTWLCAVASGEATENVITCAPEPPSGPPIFIQYGDSVDCTIDSIGDTDQMLFNGQSGETILTRVSTQAGFFAVFELRDPDGVRLVNGQQLTDPALTLTKTGLYDILVRDNGDDSTPDYILVLERVAPPVPTARALGYGDTLTGDVDPITDLDAFCFAPTQPGDPVRIRASTTAGFFAVFDLYDSAGLRLTRGAQLAELTLQQAGPHTILVHDNGFDSVSSYALNLQCFPPGRCLTTACGVAGAMLTLIKQVINDNGRIAQPNDFRLTVNNNPVASGARNTFPVNIPLAINETPFLGYEFVRITGAGCPPALGGSVVLNAGDNLTCTVTNDDRVGPIGSGTPPAPEAATEPLDLSNPRASGCTFSENEITCAETAGTTSSIAFDTNIPADARFLQFEFAFEGADGQALATESLGAPGTYADGPRQRINGEDLGEVFISNVPIAALPGSSAPPGGGFRSSGQFRLPTSGPTTATVTNVPSGVPGSVFRIRNLRIDRCTQRCFGRRPTICGTNGHDVLRGTRRSDVIVGRGL